jgi:Uma2 family endonuclease
VADRLGTAQARSMRAMSSVGTSVAWLDRLAEESGAKVELDAEGSVIVSPASDEHFLAASALFEQLLARRPAGLVVGTEGPRWTPIGGDHPSYVPDLTVIDRRALRRPRGDYRLDPPPQLVAEIVSPESRRRDLGEKADAYFAGGAGAYWTVEIPGLADVDAPAVTVRRRGVDGWDARGPFTGLFEVNYPFEIRIDLSALVA